MRPLAIEILFLFLSDLVGSVASTAATITTNRVAQLDVAVFRFENNLNYRFKSNCCLQSALCEAQCDLAFHLCLRRFDAEYVVENAALSPKLCELGFVNITKKDKEYKHGIDMGLRKSLAVTDRWPRLYTMILQAFDTKPGLSAEYLVDTTVHRGILLPDSPAEWHSHIVNSDTSSYQLSLRLACAQDYFGDQCSLHCKSVTARYTCDKHGNRICAKGWSGLLCEQPICRKGCHRIHGSCESPGECNCKNGWQGELCDRCMTYPGCRHGTCDEAPFTCQCLSNWGGPFCDQDLDYCGRHKPCLNNGVCINTNITSQPYQCVCGRGWSGDGCEIQLKACDLNPCKRGHCRDKPGGNFECVCEQGWRGELCDQNIDFCEQNLCMNGGTCQDLDGLGFRCICPRGFEGSVCQLRSPCSETQCVHAHKCTQLATATNGIVYDCTCLPGWTGDLCDKDIDDCKDKCKNGGECHDLIGDYYCTCPEGFSGRNCEINLKCASNPCKNSGICVEVEGSFKCVCPDGATGDLCEFAKRGCDPNPCENQAPCYNLSPHDYFCRCNASFFGRHCEHRRPYCGPEGCHSLVDPCADATSSALSLLQIPLLPSVTFNAQTASIPTGACGDHGICLSDETTGEGRHRCVCESGYTGRFCHLVVDACAELGGQELCSNGGVCVNNAIGDDNFNGNGFKCICPEGYTGIFCEHAQQQCGGEPCRNGGYCQQTDVGEFQCRCESGWTGRWCQLPNADPCTTSEPCYNRGRCVPDALSPNGFFCQCELGWTGQLCQTRSPAFRACKTTNPCKNGGACLNYGDSFRCLCPPGFAGARCEDDVDDCRDNPCLNGGTCRDLEKGFECACAEGFMGRDCRHNIDECVTHPCAFGAKCVDKIGGYECICPEGRSGRHCEDVHPAITPKPPSCRFNNRIYDHGEKWSSVCQTCACVEGTVVCKKEFCGYWSCLNANGDDDPFSCRPNEICHIISPAAKAPNCLTPPCYSRAVCLNTTTTSAINPKLSSLSSSSSSRQADINLALPPALPGCRPNAAFLTNQCARLGVTVSRTRLPYGVSVEDLCNAVRALPVVQKMKLTANEGGLLGMSCGLANHHPHYASESVQIEVTLTSTDERIRTTTEGEEFVFVQRFAKAVAAAISHNASINLYDVHGSSLGVQPRLPSVALMTGANSNEFYWSSILLGVSAINVETVLVKDDEVPYNPLLVPLACSLVVAVGILCTSIICVCAHRKHQELLERYTKLPVQASQIQTLLMPQPPSAPLLEGQTAGSAYYQPTSIYPTNVQQPSTQTHI